MAHVARLRVYPVKALDAEEPDAVEFTPNGTFVGDREYALFGPDGEAVNGKRTAAVHRLRSSYDAERGVLRLRGTEEPPDAAREFDLEADRGAAEAWFGELLGTAVTLRRAPERSFVDRPEAGPSVVSTATLEAVASWFDPLDVHDVRRRLRANLEIGGVPAFWEDRFVGEDAPAFVVGSGDESVRVEGVEPCGRCVVPSRDPDTGEPLAGFRERFIERRAATFPDWADPEAFPRDYALMLIARVPEADRGLTLRVGDEVGVVEGAVGSEASG